MRPMTAQIIVILIITPRVVAVRCAITIVILIEAAIVQNRPLIQILLTADGLLIMTPHIDHPVTM